MLYDKAKQCAQNKNVQEVVTLKKNSGKSNKINITQINHFKVYNQRHLVHLQCCTTTNSIYFQSNFIMAKGDSE